MNRLLLVSHKSYVYYFIMTLFVLGVNFPAFTGASLMHDAMNIYLPWAHWVTDHISEGAVPLWKIYQKGGFVQGIDPGSWYPLIWIWSLFGGFTAHSMSLMYVLHILLLTFATYKVLRLYQVYPILSVLGALMFSVNGMVIGNAQHLGYIISITWGVWMFYALKAYCNTHKLKNLLSFALFSYLALTGGYPGFSISYFYLFTGLYLFWDWKQFRHRKVKWSDFVLAFGGFLFLVLPFLYTVFEYGDMINRGGALPLDDSHWGVLSGASTWQSYLTMAMPFSTSIQSSDYWQVDQSMAINYISTIGLLLCSIGLLVKEIRSRIWVWMGIGGFFALLSLATLIPLRSLLYYVLPLFDYFRFSAIYRVFFLFSIAISSTICLDAILKQRIKFSLKWIWALVPILVISILATQVENFNSDLLYTDVFNFILSIVAVFLLLHQNAQLKLVGGMLMLVQMGWNVQAFESRFIWREGKAITVDQFINDSKSFAIHNTTFEHTQDSALRKVTHGTYVNIATITHQLSLDGYGPYVNTRFESEYPEIQDSLLRSTPFHIKQGQITDIKAIPNGVELQLVNGMGELFWVQNFHPNWKVVNVPTIKVLQDDYGFCKLILNEPYTGPLRIQFKDTTLNRWIGTSVVGTGLLLLFAFVRMSRERKTNDIV